MAREFVNIGDAIEALEDLYDVDDPAASFVGHNLSFDEAVQRLKGLKPQPHWKPTDDQMNLLEEVQQALLGKDCHNRFVNFMYDLKNFEISQMMK